MGLYGCTHAPANRICYQCAVDIAVSFGSEDRDFSLGDWCGVDLDLEALGELYYRERRERLLKEESNPKEPVRV